MNASASLTAMLVSALPADQFFVLEILCQKGAPQSLNVRPYSSYTQVSSAHENLQAYSIQHTLLREGLLDALAEVPFLCSTITPHAHDNPVAIPDDSPTHATFLQMAFVHHHRGGLRHLYLENNRSFARPDGTIKQVSTIITRPGVVGMAPIEHLTSFFKVLSSIRGPNHAWYIDRPTPTSMCVGPKDPHTLNCLGALHHNAWPFLQTGGFHNLAHKTFRPYDYEQAQR